MSPIHRRQVRSQHPTGRDPPPPNIPLTRSWGPPPGVSRRGAPAFSSSGIPEDVQLALEAVHNLVTYCPDWATRVHELSGQIKQRQLDLAAVDERHNLELSGFQPKSTKSIKNKGSMESLKPKDDGEAHPTFEEPVSSTELKHAQKPLRPSVSTDGITHQDKQASTANTSPTSSDQAKDHVMAAASANARATVRGTEVNKKRVAAAESMLTGDGAAVSKYRNKSMVIVYYDSYVQSFFEELVKFVSASRNLMRKAKMAAKVAQIKRMAELEMPDEDSGEDDEMELTAKYVPRQQSPPTLRPEPEDNVAAANATPMTYDDSSDDDIVTDGKVNESGPLAVDLKPEDDSPADMLSPSFDANQLSYSRSNGATFNVVTPTRIASPLRSSVLFSSFGGSHQSPTDAYEELDKALEVVQGMCEHAAHQFLREGECADDIAKIKDKLTETKTTADDEMQKLLENDADGALRKTLSEGPVRSRTYRSQSMRRDSAFAKTKTTVNGGVAISEESINGSPILTPRSPVTPPVTIGQPITLEVDEGIGNGSLDSKETPKLHFRSTRAMGRQISLGL